MEMCERAPNQSNCYVGLLPLMTISDQLWVHHVVSHSPQQCCKHSFSANLLKISFCLRWEGRGGVGSFTNIGGKVPTLLLCVAAPYT